MALTDKDVLHVEELAHLELTAEEKALVAKSAESVKKTIAELKL